MISLLSWILDTYIYITGVSNWSAYICIWNEISEFLNYIHISVFQLEISAFQLEISVFVNEIEISLVTPLMENWYLPRWFYTRTVHRLQIPIWRTAQFAPLIDDTEKFIKHAQAFTSLSLYSQTRLYKHSYIFGYKQAYINFIRTGRHLSCAKRQLENSPFSALFLWLVEPRLG